MEVDEMLKELGQFGKYQIFYFTLLLFPVVMCGFRATEYIFTTMDIPHRCRIPECEGTSGAVEFSPDWLGGAVPFTKNNTPEVCLRYRPLQNGTFGNSSSCPAELFSAYTETCDDWVFAEATRTVEHDFNIMCPEDYWKRTLLGSIPVIVSFIGIPLAGFVSDKVGRKTVLVYGSIISTVISVVRSLSVSYSMLACLEALDGLVTGATYSPAFLLGLETLAPEKRLLGSMLINIYFAVGEVVLAAAMWFTQDWRLMMRVFYIPMLGILITLHWLLPESVRWLRTKGRYNEIEKIFNKIAKVNKTEDKLPEIIKHLRATEIYDKDVTSKVKHQEPIKTLRIGTVLRSRVIMSRLAVCALCWIASIYTYYGISQDAVYFGDSHYLSFVLAALVEIPAIVASLWVPDWPWLGRRGATAWHFIIGGVASFALIYITTDYMVLSLLLFLVAKFCSTMTITVIYVFTAELFPTELRHSLLATCSMVGRIGSVLSQQTPLIAVYVEPMLVFGSAAIIGGALAFCCPETLNTTLPDTIQEAENIGRSSPATSKVASQTAAKE